MSITIKRYNGEQKNEWDTFIKNAKNATFLFERDYMDYHADRFTDCSFMFYKENSLAAKLYGKLDIAERHRHRYEVNNEYREALEEKGMVLSGLSPDERIVEMIELKEHPFFIATQAHPEFKSRPNCAHPLFKGFVAAAIQKED